MNTADWDSPVARTRLADKRPQHLPLFAAWPARENMSKEKPSPGWARLP